MEINFGNSGYTSEQHLFQTWLGGCGHCDGISIAAEASRNPEDIYFSDRSYPGLVVGSHHY